VISLRLAELDDLPVINEIYNHYVLHATCTYQVTPSTEEEREEWFASHGGRYPVIVAMYDGQVVGWGALSPFHPREAYGFSAEDSVYVHHRCVGNGIGSALLGQLLGLAQEIGFHTVLAGIDASQEGSLSLHSKYGFQECARYKEVGYKFGRWLDVIWMQRMM